VRVDLELTRKNLHGKKEKGEEAKGQEGKAPHLEF